LDEGNSKLFVFLNIFVEKINKCKEFPEQTIVLV